MSEELAQIRIFLINGDVIKKTRGAFKFKPGEEVTINHGDRLVKVYPYYRRRIKGKLVIFCEEAL